MQIYQHGSGIFYLWYLDPTGRRKKVSTRCRNRRDAERFAKSYQPLPVDVSVHSRRKHCPEYISKRILRIFEEYQLLEPVNGDPAFAHRVRIGKDVDKSALINLADKKGKTRIQLIVDSTGEAKSKVSRLYRQSCS
jgi:hypothetical protein